MSGDGNHPAQSPPAPDATSRGGRVALVVALVLLVAAGGWVAFRDRLTGRAAPPAAAPIETAVAAVERGDVVEREQLAGVLGFEGSYSVIGQAAQAGPPGQAAQGGGVITWLPQPGRVVRRGQRLYEVDNQAVRLLYGGRAASRAFTLGMTDGPDVAQLERNLVRMGYDPDRAVTVDRRFSRATRAAVRRWQRAMGEPATGVVPLGRVVFMPGELRVSQAAVTVGGPLPAGLPVLTATGITRVVAVELDPGSAALVRRGDEVMVTTLGGDTVPARVTDVSRVAVAPQGGEDGGDGGGGPRPPSIAVTIRLDGPPDAATARLDQAPVQVAISTRKSEGVLTVPVTALLARHGGGYELTILGAAGASRRVPVEVGLYDEVTGRIEVEGAGLAEGDRIQVPVE